MRFQWHFQTALLCLLQFSLSFRDYIRSRFIPHRNEPFILLEAVSSRPFSAVSTNSVRNNPNDLPGTDTFRLPCSDHCIITLLVCLVNSTWPTLQPITYKRSCDSTNHLSQKKRNWHAVLSFVLYHKFLIYRRIINSKKVLYSNTLSIINLLIAPSCRRRGSGGDRDPRRWGKRETIPNATLSPPEWLLHYEPFQRLRGNVTRVSHFF